MITLPDNKGYKNNDYIIRDGEVCPVAELDALMAKADRKEVYEVLRIKGGIPVFPQEHYERFVHSFKLIGRQCLVTEEEFCAQIEELVRLCEVDDQNVRIEQYVDEEDGKEHIYMYLIPTHYPTAENYRDGVTVGYLHGERNNPQAKISDVALRGRADQALIDSGFFEVMLVNHNGEITEGSRTNFFFIKDDTVYASPSDTILPGITRLMVLKILEEHHVPYVEQTVRADCLDQFDAAFLTATSPNVLPVARAAGFDKPGMDGRDVTFDANNKLLRDLMQWFKEEALAEADD